MIFSSLTFFIFFIVVMLLLIVFSNQKIRRVILLLSSYFFYGSWDWRFLSLIIVSTIVDYISGKEIYKSKTSRRKKFFLVVSLCMNLGILGFFKYFNFFIGSANNLFGSFGFNISTLNIILPVGISFFTFQTMSYTIDIYRKQLIPARNLLEFSIFVAFFPQLVAGPIVRAVDFIPQLERNIVIKKTNIILGLQIFIIGLVKKVLIADRLAYFVDYVFESQGEFNSLTLWLAVISYGLQIYLDFSGYSDMAIGIARCMGFRLPVNFKMPYLSLNVTDFWKRWHISLSSWLKDYLYISLGGNRVSKIRTNINLLLTMTLGGLWHGASWNFVIWGLMHGIALIIHKYYSTKIIIFNNFKNHNLYKLVSWFVTYLYICITWIFFRSKTLFDSLEMIKRMFNFNTNGISFVFTPLYVILPFVVICHYIGKNKYYDKYFLVRGNTFKGAFILISITICIFFMTPLNSSPFIYFQF